ncbi:MAG: hypothetical protein R3A51_12550 [Nannocystaceae bacterium]|nr:hypothetical protein [Myxococcales bacterium]
MARDYTEVRRSWRSIDTRADLEAIWRGERFESSRAIEDALRVYELAIRVDGWEAVKGWAAPLLERGAILNAQLVELAMRSIEQRDPAFFEAITVHLLGSSPPNYFRFWRALFTTRHSSFGERLFRKQLAELSDFHVVKYRRQLRAILRRLRFRCKSPRERAIGAVAFAEYSKYSAKEYPSELFAALVECQKVARTPPRSKKDKPVSRTQHVAVFAEAAAALGIWSVTEGIRTSAKLPRTLTYLSAMAPKMTDNELRRGLRAFDGQLKTATHKKASEQVVALAELIKGRLRRMEVPLADWAKAYPYLESQVLRRVLEALIDAGVDAHIEALGEGPSMTPVIVVPEGLEGRRFRAGLLGGYVLYRLDSMAALALTLPHKARVLQHPTALLPYGCGVPHSVQRWRATPRRPHQVLHDLVRGTFPDAAKRRASEPVELDPTIAALRAHLRRRAVVDGGVGASDVPVILLTHEPRLEERDGLRAHLQMFPGAALVLLESEWSKPLEDSGVLCLSVPATVTGVLTLVEQLRAALPGWSAGFAESKDARDREVRHLLLGAAPGVEFIPCGAPGLRGTPQV